MPCEEELTALDLTLAPPSLHLSSASSSSSVSLYSYILFNQSHALNILAEDDLARVLRPFDERDLVRTNEEVESMTEGLESGTRALGGCVETQEGEDDELIIHVRFSELLRVKSILIGTGGGKSPAAPRLTKIYVNRPNGLSFDEIPHSTPAQEFELLEGEDGTRGSVEYPVRLSKFNNVRELSFYFAGSRGGVCSRLFYLGFMGEARAIKKEPDNKLKVGAETGVTKMVEGVRETKGSGLASVR